MTTDAERALEVVRRHAPRYPGYYSILAKDIAAALAAVRADERERAARIADRCAAERHAQIQPCADAGGDLEALMGKHSEARRIADAIRRQEG